MILELLSLSKGLTVNIQKLAEEYRKLQLKKYIYGLDNGEKISFSFKDDNFFHLLGFQKFNDVTVVKMINHQAFPKDKFYKEVLNGNITYDKFEYKGSIDENYLTNGKVTYFCDAEETQEVKRVLDNRFPYFSYNYMNELMDSNLIVLYDKSMAPEWHKIDADKIFFKFYVNEKRHLNFFIKKDKEKNFEAPVSFFLEEQLNDYINTTRYCAEKEQKKARIIFRVIQDTSNGEYILFNIPWNKVRHEYSRAHSEYYKKAETKLHDYYYKTGVPVRSDVVAKDLSAEKLLLNKVVEELELYEKQCCIYFLVTEYRVAPTEEKGFAAAMELLDDYEIDIDKEDNCEKYASLDIDELRAKIAGCKEKITKSRNKIKKFDKALSALYELEKEEIIYVYESVLPEIVNYSDEFFEKLVSEYGILDKTLYPNEIRKIHKKSTGKQRREKK